MAVPPVLTRWKWLASVYLAGKGWSQSGWEKGKPLYCLGQQVSTGSEVTVATLPALPVPDPQEGEVAAGGQGQNRQWLPPACLAVAGGDVPALCDLPWLRFPALLSSPSLPIARASRL